MPLFAALTMLASLAAGADRPAGRGVELAGAQVEATILVPGRVRQGSGREPTGDGPAAQVTRRAGEILVEFQ
jgi:hypothetical protein